MKLSYKTNEEVKEAIKRADKVIKETTGADYVINTDITAIYGFLDRKKIQYSCNHETKDIEGYQIRCFEDGLKVAIVNFNLLGRIRDPYLKQVVSKNFYSEERGKVARIDHDTKTVWTKENDIYYCETEEDFKHVVLDKQEEERELTEWAAFTGIKESLTLNGEFQNVGKSVYMYFLECLPPVDFNGTDAICGEALDIQEGAYTYYFFTKTGDQHKVSITNKRNCFEALRANKKANFKPTCMNLEQIKKAVNDGLKVHWCNPSYQVIKNKKGKYFIKHSGGHLVSLTNEDGNLNEDEREFYTLGEKQNS